MSDGAPPGAETAAERLRTIYATGDRPCARCGFNLAGQPVAREPHYGLLLLRCPECGEAASVQEYPLLGRWANRLGVLVAACLIVVMIVAFVACVGVAVALAEGASHASSQKFGVFISQRHTAWWETLPQEKKDAISGGNTNWNPSQAGWYYVSKDWWTEQDRGALLREAGGRLKATDWEGTLWGAMWVAPIGGVVGMFWALAVLGQQRWRVALGVPAIVVMAALFLLLMRARRSQGWTWPGGQWEWGPHVAERILAWHTVPAALGWLLLWMLVGVWLGRPFSRLAVRALLPPRLRSGLSVLWTAEGKEMPRPTRQF